MLGEGHPFTGRASNSRQFLAVDGSPEIAVSSDGAVWTMHRVSQRAFTQEGPVDVARSESLALWAGVDREGTIHTSRDGVRWEQQLSPFQQTWRAVCASDKRFVAVGNAGAMAASDNGLEWRALPQATAEAILDVVWTGTRFVAVATEDTLLTSDDGLSWRAEHLSVPSLLIRLTWTGSQLLAVAKDRDLYSSSDAIHWTQVSDGLKARTAAVGGGRIVAVGGFGEAAESHDLAQWSACSFGWSFLWLDVCCGKGRFVAAGIAAGIVYSDPLPEK